MSTISLLSLSNPEALTQSADWHSLCLASGYPGLILLFSHIEHEHSDEILHRLVVQLKQSIEEEGIPNLSMYSGAAGIALALSHTRYRKMLEAVHRLLLDRVEDGYLTVFEKNLSEGVPSFASLYDPIQGICGIGRYLLEHLEWPGFEPLARKITTLLVKLSLPLVLFGKTVPGWFMPAEDPLNAKNRSRDPGGNFNLGLAHGVTGVLAYLTIALERNLKVEGQREAMARIAQWIRSKSWLTPRGIAWPYTVSWEEEIGEIAPRQQTSRDAWCYGAPGICRTLFLAGKSLGDHGLVAFASQAFRDVFRRTREEWQLPGPTLCHGLAGLLLIARAMGETEYAQLLEPQVRAHFEPESLWGFRDAEPHANKEYRSIDKAGFLEGASGVWLTLLAEKRTWALPLLIDV